MAIVINPALSIDASGNVGGLCYAKWRGLQVARGAWTGTIVPTSEQIIYENKLITVVQAWGQVLTEAERQTWRDRARMEIAIARLGIRYTPSGFQLFTKWNMQRSVIGLGILNEAPKAADPFLVTDFVVAVHPGGGSIDCTLSGWGAVGEPDWIQYFRAGPFNSQGYHALSGQFRLKDIERPAGSFNDGAVIVGQWYWYRGRAGMDSGRSGNWFEAQVKAA